MNKKSRYCCSSILTFVLFILTFGVNAQQEWAPYEAVWYYCIPDLATNNPLYSYEKYIVVKDTVINSHTCRVVKSNYNTEYFYQDGFKVYYWFNNKFNLIYDFDVKIGDTIVFDFKSISSDSTFQFDTTYEVSCIVESINYNKGIIISPDNNFDSIKTINTKILKREDLDFLIWKTEYSYSEKYGYWYEFLNLLRGTSLDYTYWLRCYFDNDISLKSSWWMYYFEDYSCDFSLVGINDSEKNDLLNVYPNPCGDVINLEIKDNITYDKLTAYLINKSGIILKQIDLCNKINILNMANIKPGIYYLKVINKEQQKIQLIKIIKL